MLHHFYDSALYRLARGPIIHDPGDLGSISAIYPNPSNGRFQIDLANFPGGQGTVRVFNLLGQEIRNYDLNGLSPGRHFLDMDTNGSNGRPMGSGMVFVRVETKKEQVIRKCVILNN